MDSAERVTCNFNPRSPHGERRRELCRGGDAGHFNPRSPHGERRIKAQKGGAAWSFQSTLPARGATLNHEYPHPKKPISIHAPRTGSDMADLFGDWVPDISIHAPRTGSDVINKIRANSAVQFQSTLPARGATCRPVLRFHPQRHFNPRSPHGERQSRARNKAVAHHFNPRSPHGERLQISSQKSSKCTFQSTLPARGATALRCIQLSSRRLFQSTLPARGATQSKAQSTAPRSISIHAPRTGSDHMETFVRNAGGYFNPRSPHGERRVLF